MSGTSIVFADTLDGLINGCDNAWARVFEAFQPSLLGKARELLRNTKVKRRVAPEDLVNTCFMKAIKSSETFSGTNSRQLAAWLITILRNSFISECRPLNLEESGSVWRFHDSGKSPSQCAISNEEEAKLHACIAELNDRHREVIVRRHLEGKKFREIADEVGLTPGEVAGRNREGIKALLKCFGVLTVEN